MRIAKPWKLLAAVMAFVMLAAVGVVALTNDLTYQLSKSADEAEHKRNVELVRASLHGMRVQLEKFVADNATWDDAVRHVYDDVDEAWVQETWGVTAGTGMHAYDRMILVDGTTNQALADYREGTKLQKPLDDELQASVAQLISDLQQHKPEKKVTSGLSHTRFGVSILAAAPVVPTSQDMIVPQAKPNYLVLLKEFDEDLVADIVSQINITSLKVAPPGQGQLQLSTNNGDPLVSIDWQDAKSGTLASQATHARANITILVMLAAMACVGLCCWYYLNRMLQNEARARHNSLHDALTGLPNRSALVSELRALYASGSRDFAIAFADLDGFKHVNDSFGHLLGDRLLRKIADGLRDRRGKARLLCRMGGDEFVALFTGPSALDECKDFAADMVSFVARPFDFDGRIASVGASVGIASPLSDAGDSEELLRCADIAMYRAKILGKNQCCIYDKEFDADRQSNREIESELRTILREKSMDVAYQPVVDATTGSIVSVEALARWPKTSSLHLPPDKFIRVAELSGLIGHLGGLVLEKSCLAAKAWGELNISVNVSPLQLNNPDFLHSVKNTLATTGLPPNRLEFEITENVLIDNFDRTRRVLESLRSLGVKLALDDFGSGYSSIGYLRQFRFDRVKIDRSISSKITEGPVEQGLVHGIMLVAKGLSANVTAEGVEREEEVTLLRLAGCTTFQGYYFHRPMDEQKIASLFFGSQEFGKSARIA